MASRSFGSEAVSLTVFLLLSAVLAVAVGILASLLLSALVKDQRRLEIHSNDLTVSDAEVLSKPTPGSPEEATQIEKEHSIEQEKRL
jgi:hypothetical protein